jgi:DNA-binding NtrC family response regulator
VLAATNRDLLVDVHGARFRQDLYYRLCVIEVVVPPLRERRDDTLPLARQLLASAAKWLGRKAPALDGEVQRDEGDALDREAHFRELLAADEWGMIELLCHLTVPYETLESAPVDVRVITWAGMKPSS